MRSKFQTPSILAGALLLAQAALAAPASPGAPQVMGWVPPYGVEKSLSSLETIPGVGEGLTRLGLQLWNPSADGRGLVLAPVDKTGKQVAAADVLKLRDWAKARGIKVFLTVYNNSQVLGRWDWDLAKRAFAGQRKEFSAALVAEMEKYGLDGIDLDLEGEGDLSADRAAYAAFVAELSPLVKAKGKLLTVDSFHSPCANAPNMAWWKDWRGQVDAIHSMGYADLYEGSKETFTPEGQPVCEGGAAIFKYSWQQKYGVQAGYRADQILLGVPTWVDTWGSGGLGADLVSHLRELQALGAGVALWDLQLEGPNWRRPEAWEAVRALRGKGTAGPAGGKSKL